MDEHDHAIAMKADRVADVSRGLDHEHARLEHANDLGVRHFHMTAGKLLHFGGKHRWPHDRGNAIVGGAAELRCTWHVVGSCSRCRHRCKHDNEHERGFGCHISPSYQDWPPFGPLRGAIALQGRFLWERVRRTRDTLLVGRLRRQNPCRYYAARAARRVYSEPVGRES